ncbi:MAG: hypothetical protein ABJQ34_16290 [Paracoccaceae bacterium]
MSRGIVLSTIFLSTLAAIGGYFLGTRHATLDESVVISAVVRVHLDTYGGQPSDCFAMHGRGKTWLRVTCNDVSYDVNRQGVILENIGSST